jgi:hypothetical protein
MDAPFERMAKLTPLACAVALAIFTAMLVHYLYPPAKQHHWGKAGTAYAPHAVGTIQEGPFYEVDLSSARLAGYWKNWTYNIRRYRFNDDRNKWRIVIFTGLAGRELDNLGNYLKTLFQLVHPSGDTRVLVVRATHYIDMGDGIFADKNYGVFARGMGCANGTDGMCFDRLLYMAHDPGKDGLHYSPQIEWFEKVAPKVLDEDQLYLPTLLIVDPQGKVYTEGMAGIGIPDAYWSVKDLDILRQREGDAPYIEADPAKLSSNQPEPHSLMKDLRHLVTQAADKVETLTQEN